MTARLDYEPPLQATPGAIAFARGFLLVKWKERALERGSAEPSDLSNGCKFAYMFAQRVFGGALRGNWDHQFVTLPSGQLLDLTAPCVNVAELAAANRDPYRHDVDFWGNHEHLASMASCEPRVTRWVGEFLAQLDAAPAKSSRARHRP